jgi:hypothetical protein
MNLDDYPHYFMYVLVIYMLTAAFSFNFLFTSVQYGILEGMDAALIMLPIIVPVVLLALYAMKGRVLFIFQHRKALRYAATAVMLVSIVFTSFIIIPLYF